MEEEVSQRVVGVVISAGKLTASVLARALAKVIAVEKEKAAAKARGKAPERKTGKMTLEELTKQNAGAVNIEINEGNIKSFDRVARKYGIDYAVKKDKTCDPPKYFVFFKARDQDAMTAAFKEFVYRNQQKKSRPSFRERLAKYVTLSHSMSKNKTREKVRQRERAR